ncbi:MAG: glycosyl hydrolase family 8 [Chitinispirillia bacterium]|nr:glycosyl hydrolase family 8 [Chitinispirillia bacterium]
MLKRTIKLTSVLIFALSTLVFSQYNPLYYSSLPKVSAPYDTILQKTWEGVKKRNINAFPLSNGLVHRPKSETPGDAVSEGVSYGMLLALYMNDQEYFNKVWEAGDRHMGVSGSGGGYYYDWRVNANTAGTAITRTGTGAASDADQDIALLLIFANELVKVGIWEPYSRPVTGSGTPVTYESRARSILQVIRTVRTSSGMSRVQGMIDENYGYLLPGFWGESTRNNPASGTVNPGYFAPAFYRVFAEFEPAHAAVWNTLIDTSYAHIRRSPGYARGLLPDWTRVNGTSTGGAGYNAYFRGDAMYRDAIRVYWRLATDYLWYQEPRAKAFLDNAMAFIEDTLRNRGGSRGGIYGPDAVNFFTMNGDFLPEDDIERLAGGTITRSRREHSHLTAGMWAAAAIGTGNMELAEKYSDKLLEFYTRGEDFWGNAADPAGGRHIAAGSMVNPNFRSNLPVSPTNPIQVPFEVNANVPEDTLTNEMYFDQFLAWFGASMISGVFTNVWADLKDGNIPQRPQDTVTSVINRRASPAEKFSLRKSGSLFILTTPANMAGADVRIVNVKGVVAKRATMPQNGRLAISARELGAGMYFVDVKKAGKAGVRMPLGNVK